MNAKVKFLILVSVALVIGISGQVSGQGNGSGARTSTPKHPVKRTKATPNYTALPDLDANSSKSGKRKTVTRNSHDRYANQEISYAKGGGEVSMGELHLKRKVKSGQKHSQRLAKPKVKQIAPADINGDLIKATKRPNGRSMKH